MPSGGGTTTTTSTENNAPWGPEQASIKTALNAGGLLYQNNPLGPSYYPGQTYAPLNGTENSALGGIFNTGMGGTSSLNAANSGLAAVAGSSLDPNSNPYLQSAEDNTIANTLAPIQSGFNAGGRADSGLASAAAANGLGTALGNLNYGQYNTDAQQKISAGLVAPGINQATLGGQEAAFGAGQTQQQNSQNIDQAAMNKYNYQQMQPYNALSLFEGELQNNGGLAGYGTTNGTSSQPYYTNGFANFGSAASGLGALALGLGSGGSNSIWSSLMNI